VLRGESAGRDSADQVTVFDSVGFALEAFSALRFMMDSAVRLGMGERIALIPQLADPKNLFGLLAAPASVSERLTQIATTAHA
jgi:ornithine cyclodeaminase